MRELHAILIKQQMAVMNQKFIVDIIDHSQQNTDSAVINKAGIQI